jgi:hypothetical protein
MKNLIIVLICLMCITLNTNAQLFKKLKEKVAGATTSTQNTQSSQTDGNVEEDKVKNIGNSYTIKTDYGDIKYDIDKSAEIIAENKSAESTTQHFLTTTKKQYVFHSITTDKNNAATKMEKTVVNKNQIAYCANTAKYVEGQYEVTIFLLSSPIKKRIEVGNNAERDVAELKLVLYTNTVEKANSLISSILGKDVNGSQVHKFIYITGDGKVIKTSANPFWSLRDGQLYFESLPSEKALRVTYFEINKDPGEKEGTYLVKVTLIPSDAIGDYKNFSFEGKDFYLPLKKSITKTIYDKQEAATTEVITDRFRLASNEFGSVVTNEYCNIVSQQLSADVKEKFKKEVQQPIVAKRLAEEKERERLYAESQRNSGSSGSGSSSSSGSSSKQKSEFYVKLYNKSDVKVKVETRKAKGSGKSQFEVNPRNSVRSEVQVGGSVYVNGTLIATITAGMEGQEIVIAQ